MEERIKLQESLCVSSLSVHLVGYDNAHHLEMRSRKIHNSFGLILKGSVEFSTLTEKHTAKEGDLIFVPEGIRYASHWNGSPQIQFYNVHFTLPKKALGIWRKMGLQRIEGVPFQEIKSIMEQMLLCAKGSEVDHLKAYALFYELTAKVLPYMKVSENRFPQASLENAIAYIEANYRTITSVQEIATACYLSESRLYHLFRDHLDISPISYLNNLRIHHAMEMLSNPDLSIQQIAEELNFHSEYYFRKTFKKITGVLPSQFRKML